MAPTPDDHSGSIPVSALQALHGDTPTPPALTTPPAATTPPVVTISPAVTLSPTVKNPTINGKPVDPSIATLYPNLLDQKPQPPSTPGFGSLPDLLANAHSSPTGTTVLPSGTIVHRDVTNDGKALTTHTTVLIPGQSGAFYGDSTEDLTPYLNGSQKLPTDDNSFNRLWNQSTPDRKMQSFQHDTSLGN